jgi:hypothetical protein
VLIVRHRVIPGALAWGDAQRTIAAAAGERLGVAQRERSHRGSRKYPTERPRQVPGKPAGARYGSAAIHKIYGGFVLRDANEQAFAYVYAPDKEAEARQAKVLTTDETRGIAVNIARLPKLLGKGD